MLECHLFPQGEEVEMKSFMLMAGSGPLMILTSHTSIEDPVILEKLAAKGLDKFLAYEIPIELAKERYGGHFTVVANDLHETDDLRVLDYNGERAFKLFTFAEMGTASHDRIGGSRRTLQRQFDRTVQNAFHDVGRRGVFR